MLVKIYIPQGPQLEQLEIAQKRLLKQILALPNSVADIAVYTTFVVVFPLSDVALIIPRCTAIPSQPVLFFLLNAACLAEKQQIPIVTTGLECCCVVPYSKEGFNDDFTK
jgi:hypothetical protein